MLIFYLMSVKLSKFNGAQITLVDATLGTGGPNFSEMERKISVNFKTKPRRDDVPMQFSCFLIENIHDSFRVQQFRCTSWLKSAGKTLTTVQFAKLRGTF